jgi:hypothetical protein
MFVALSAAIAPSAKAIPTEPSWRGNYTAALKEGQGVKRPLAIFVASGAEGWDKLSKEGELDKEVKQLLQNRYVCVYLDTTTDHGRRMAGQLELTDGRGLVISDAAGEYQAFRHAGTLSNEDLNRYLRKYSDPERAVVRTETVAQASPTTRPTQYAPPTYYQQPAFYAPVMGGFGGGCRS